MVTAVQQTEPPPVLFGDWLQADATFHAGTRGLAGCLLGLDHRRTFPPLAAGGHMGLRGGGGECYSEGQGVLGREQGREEGEGQASWVSGRSGWRQHFSQIGQTRPWV